MRLPQHKTKIVCTIGRASRSEKVLERLIHAGMNVARLNFSHGTLEEHREVIQTIRKLSKATGKVVAILGDLPGPKIRIGKLSQECIRLRRQDNITITTENIIGDQQRIPCTYKKLPKSVRPGNIIFLNDGFLQLKVRKVRRTEIDCTVMVGGPLMSHKGLNVPQANISERAVTRNDFKIIDFALQEQIDALSISFIKSATDIKVVRDYLTKKRQSIFIVAKIERPIAVQNSKEIMAAADAVMVARGDLGVEIPLEQVPMVQKQLIHQANLLSRPVITATQMLESMIDHIRPTRAEVTDVANAILDGTDAIMLSAETAVGENPVEAVKTMVRIARYTEQQKPARAAAQTIRDHWRKEQKGKPSTIKDTISHDVAETVEQLDIRYILAPTDSGDTPRRIARFKPQCWILAFTSFPIIRNVLQFSWGVWPFLMEHPAASWDRQLIDFATDQGLSGHGDRLLLTEGVPLGRDTGTNSLRIITIK